MKYFKYYDWKTNESGLNYTEDNLKNSSIYFSRPSKFNDPFDLKPYINFTEEDIAYLNEHFANQGSAAISYADYLNDIREREKFNQFFLELFDNMGVFCCTNRRNNLLMWSHYADEHRGVCLGFSAPLILQDNPEVNLDGMISFQEVKYSDKRVKLGLVGINEFCNAVLVKHSGWKYEKEYRSIIPHYSGVIKYHPECLTEVILGCRMPEKEQERIKSILQKRTYKPKLYLAKLKEKTFGLNFVEIKY